MVKLRLLLYCLILIPYVAFSQGKRPQVLIYGNGVDAYAAALQSSMSNLNTVWVVEGDKIVPELTSGVIAIASGKHLDAGVWADLLAKTLRHDKRSDSLSAIAKTRINPQIAQNVVDDVVGSARNLTIVRGVGIRAMKKSGKDWQIELANRQRYKVRAVVDASEGAALFRLAFPDGREIGTRTVVDDGYFQSDENLPLSRTGVAVAEAGGRGFTMPLAALIPADDSNVFLTRSLPAVQRFIDGTESIPLLAHVGQAVGAAAAYTAFFKTTSDKLDVRNVQGELLQYGARLIPFVDVPIESPHFAAIQRIGATGVLDLFVDSTGEQLFRSERQVSSQEIRPVMNQLFSRSQIWFVDNGDIDSLTLSDLLSLIKYVGHRGNELEGQVQKNWKRRFQFEDEYDEQMPVTRRHFAVLLDAYCKPFDVKVGFDGSIQR